MQSDAPRENINRAEQKIIKIKKENFNMRNNKNNKYFKVTKLYHKAMTAMSDKQAGEFIKALSTYVFTEETPKVTDPFVYGLLVFAKKDIDTAMKNRENGRLGALALARKKQEQQDEAICDCPVDCILMEEMFEDLIKDIKNHLQTAAQPDGESRKNAGHTQAG